MSVRIYIDSSADPTAAVREKCTVVPLTVRFGEEEFTDGITIDYKLFYKKLAECPDLPATSQPTPAAFAAVYDEAVSAGDQVVVVTISSKLSGTYQSASIAAMDYPDRVYVVDSMNAAIGTGILAELGLSLAESGMSAADIAQQLTEERGNIRLYAMVDTLEYLKRGGRISKTVAFAGELLSIKPIITVQDGVVEMVGKARGAKQGNLQLSKLALNAGVDFSKPLLLGFTGLSDTALNTYIEGSSDVWGDHPVNTAAIGSVIGTHVGPGAVAMAFFKKHD